MLPLFDLYPELSGRIPHLPLGLLPTPVESMSGLGSEIGVDRLFVKRDDLSGAVYGGNKVRKLEFLLGRATHDGAKTVITFGAAGSNHALATAIYARQAGLNAVSMLVPQHNARSVRRNLLRGLRAGADLHACTGVKHVAASVLAEFLRRPLAEHRLPQVIPVGGTSAIGILGFVNAVFELKDQMEAGLLPEPAFIYVAAGTLGTSIGLLLGAALTRLKSRIVAVRVTGERFIHERKARRLFHAANAYLSGVSPAIPAQPWPGDQFELRHDFYGEDYALYTEAGMEAVRCARNSAGITLEGTYTGKAFAALLADARQGRLHGQSVLFWNTYNSRSLEDDIAGMDYHQLPPAFHRYFEEEVQPLDR